MMRSLPRYLIHITAVLLLLGGAAVAIASRSEAESPPPGKPLTQAIGDALAAPAPPGFSGRIEFSNRLVDADAVTDGQASPLLSDATGRFWVTGDGRARLEIQSPAGDAQVQVDGDRVKVYDPASRTVYTAALPGAKLGERPGAGAIQQALGRLARGASISDARPGTVGGQAAYTVRLAPRHDGGLLGAAEIAWDAAHGMPLRGAVYAQGEDEPVLELEATDVSFEPVADGDVEIAHPADARVVEIDDVPAQAGGDGRIGPKAGIDAVQARLSFPLSAPASLAGLPRRSVRTLSADGRTGALVSYGRGLGALMVVQVPAGDDDRGLGAAGTPGLQELSLDGTTAHELATALGTVIQFERDGVSYTVVGSVPPAAAEAAARAL